MYDQARERGWLVLQEGEAYSKTIAFLREVYLFAEEDDTWTIWWGKWFPGVKKPAKEKVVAQGLSFPAAIDRADDYAEWFVKRFSRK